MESIFESLENLEVSEACFDEIIESIFQQIKKVYGKPEYKEPFKTKPLNKSAELIRKAKKNKREEEDLAINKEVNDNNLPLSRAKIKISSKRDCTKNVQGERKTDARRRLSVDRAKSLEEKIKVANRAEHHKTPEEKIKASIARNKTKQEKKINN